MENNKKNRKTSLILEDQIVEMVYDSGKEETSFVSYRGGQIEYIDTIKRSGIEYCPLDSRSDLISKKIILFPSNAVEYGTEEELIKDLRAFIHRYLDVSADFEEIATYYVIFTWLYDRFNEVPYLRAIGDFGTGKSRFLRTIGSVCYKPIFTGGATTSSPIFRILNDIGGTLILDEADYKSSETSDDIVKILNMGFQRGGSVMRSEGKGIYEVKAYDVFSPKIVGTRETFSDRALESRFLVEEMNVGTFRTDIPHRLPNVFYDEALELRNKLLMWRFRNYFKPLTYDEKLIEGTSSRLQQIATPLLSIIESPEMKEKLRIFVHNYSKELIADRGQSRESEIIYAIAKLEREGKARELTMKEIANNVNQDSQLDFDDQISPKKIGWYLRKKLLLRSRRTRNGFVLDLDTNKKKLNSWKGRLGITDEELNEIDSEPVNNDNNATKDDFKGLTAEEVGF